MRASGLAHEELLVLDPDAIRFAGRRAILLDGATSERPERPGRFEAAHDGTLLIDEVGEVSPGSVPANGPGSPVASEPMNKHSGGLP